MKGKTNSSSAGLNLKIVGGTTQPTAARENTIWVDTDADITSWVFSADEPESPVEGMTWFNIGTSSTAPINILKKNTLMVYPLSCQQFIGGKWTGKTAKTYKGENWLDWALYLYNLGDTCDAVSGGWAGRNGTASATNNADHLYCLSNQSSGLVATGTKIDVTNFTKMVIDSQLAATYAGVTIGLIASYTGSAVAYIAPTTDRQIQTIDISALSGEFYAYVNVPNAACKLYSMYLM